jgi:oligopeptide transport system substrate-binding protein
MRSKLFTLIGLLVLASMILAACTPPAPTAIVETVIVEVAGTPQVIVVTPEPVIEEKPAVLRINMGTYPDIIDPQKSSFVNEIAHLKLFYEGLTRLDQALETVPGAAESWEYNEDATQLTFQLRSDLKYSDGTLLNAKRFEYSILRNIDPATAGEYAGITDEIIGAPEWRMASAEDLEANGDALKAAVEVRALDAAGNACVDYEQADCLTLQLKFAKPAPYFHTVMSLWVTFPAKEENITEGGDIWWNSSKFQIGNGPFVMQNLEPFVRAYFVPNPNYWAGTASYDIEYSFITEGAVAFEAYKNNEFDIIGLGADDLATVQADPVLSTEANIYPGSCTYAFYMNKDKPPFDDPKVREAFSYGTNRDAWVSDILKGLGSPTLTWIPKGFPGYDETEDRWQYDVEKAKATIAESTYGSFESLPEITLTFSGTSRNIPRFEWLANQWTTNLGVKVKLDPVESTTYTALTKERETLPQVFYLGWCADYADPQNWLSVYWMTTSAFAQRYGFSNPEMDALMQEADATLDPVKRADLYLQAQKLLVGDAAVIMMVNNVNSYLIKPWVKDVKFTPMDAGWPGDVDPLSITIDTSLIP